MVFMKITSSQSEVIVLFELKADRNITLDSSLIKLGDYAISLKIDSESGIIPLLVFLHRNYINVEKLTLLFSDNDIYDDFFCYFYDVFQSLHFLPDLSVLKIGEYRAFLDIAKRIPHFDYDASGVIYSEELQHLIEYFRCDNAISDFSSYHEINVINQNFLNSLSFNVCGLAIFIQIRLLSYLASRVNKYGEAYLRSLSLLFGDNQVLGKTLWALSEDNRFSIRERFFIYNQLLAAEFSGRIKNAASFATRFSAYSALVRSFYSELQFSAPFIDRSDRNPNLVFVFTAQFLGLTHAPSKMAFEVIKSLFRCKNMQVVLIDTCELLPSSGAIPWYDPVYGNRGSIFDNVLTIEDVSFNYLKLSNNMPNVEEISGIISLINEYKPYFTITIGESITADIVSQIVPNLVVPTVSRLPHTLSQFRLADSSISRDGLNITHPDFLNGIIDFRFVPNIKSVYTPKPSSLESSFNIAIVGNRLDTELKDDFFIFLESLLDFKVRFIFIGNFATYQDWCRRYSFLAGHSESLGFQSDLQESLSNCHVFLNYPRMGGGHSALYAMRSGLPVLTLKNCDVYSVLGYGFDSYQDIQEELLKLITSEDYLVGQSLKSQSIAADILDKNENIYTLMEKLTSSSLFNLPGFISTNFDN